MAAYPSHNILLDSSQELEQGIVDEYSEGGIQHSRTFHSQQYYRFTLLHSLTIAQFTSLLSTYAAGPRDFYTLTYHSVSPQVTYNVKFTAPPEIVDNFGNSRFKVEVHLRGYRN
jgi:hypothetical protein